jgi:two-component system, cell cycle response regulator DivK
MSPQTQSVRILLVEDNETIRRAFAILLEDSGYEVLQAGSGKEALEISAKRSPHLVLMDLGLPDMNGLEVTRALKSDPVTSSIVVVAITGRALESDEQACQAAGCSGYLAKPIDTQQILGKIPEFLNLAPPPTS